MDHPLIDRHRPEPIRDDSACYGLHPAFSDEINRAFVRSEIEGGVFKKALPIGAVLDVQTINRVYRIVNCEDSDILIMGHPEFCPEPVRVQLHGCTFGGSMIRQQYIGRGMHMEFRHPVFGIVLTTEIQEITERPAQDALVLAPVASASASDQ